MSSPRAIQLREMFDQYLRLTEGQTAVEASASLGVDDTYISKLRTGWRPSRVREDLWQRLVAVLASAARGATRVSDGGAGAWGERGPQFYDGVLYAAQAMAETQARLIAEARAGLASQLNPDAVRAALDEGEKLIRDGEQALATKDQATKKNRRPA